MGARNDDSKPKIMTMDLSTVVVVVSLAFKFTHDPVTGELSVAYTSAYYSDAQKNAAWAVIDKENPIFRGTGYGAWTPVRRSPGYAASGLCEVTFYDQLDMNSSIYQYNDPVTGELMNKVVSSAYIEQPPEWMFKLLFNEDFTGTLPAKIAKRAEEAYQVYVRHMLESE